MYTDGGCSGNQSNENFGGWGAILEFGDNKKELHGGEANTTNNRMCLMWSNSVAPAIAGARFVVSERGDILSPKYAPVTMAPAAIAVLTPSPVATPISATPTVPAVVHDDPVASDTIQQSRHGRSGWRTGYVSRAL